MLSKKAILHTCKIHESYPAPFSLSQGKEGEEGITQTPQDTWFGISCETWMHSLMLGSWVTPSRAMNSVSHHRGKSSILLCNVCKIIQDASSWQTAVHLWWHISTCTILFHKWRSTFPWADKFPGFSLCAVCLHAFHTIGSAWICGFIGCDQTQG